VREPRVAGCDGSSRRIEASQKTVSHSISERSNSDENSTVNPDEKRSNMPSKPLSEINNVLHKSGAVNGGDRDRRKK